MSADGEGGLMPDKAEVRSRLTERLAVLTAQIGRIEGELGRPLDDDFAEQAVDREGDEALNAVESAALAEIDLTRKAIARLDAGSYGICTGCGEMIAPARLAALPIAAECISCAGAPHSGKA